MLETSRCVIVSNLRRMNYGGPNMNGPVIQMFHRIVEWAATGIEAMAVLFIVAAVVNLAIRQGTIRYLYQLGNPAPSQPTNSNWERRCCCHWN